MNNDIVFFLSRYNDLYPFFIPLGAIGIWRWSIWLTKKITGLFYKLKKSTYKSTVSVITPVYNENPNTFIQAIQSWKENNPHEIIAVIDYTDNACVKIFSTFAKRNKNAKLIVTKTPGKREALADGIRAATGNLVALVDSDTIWTNSTLVNALPPFINRKVGGVATRQSVENPKTIAQKLFSIRLEQRYWDDVPFLSTVGDQLVCLSGRTAFYRRNVLKPFLDDLVHEQFMGEKVISGEDKRLTYLIESNGWKTAYQSTSQIFTTGEPKLSAYINQQIRWTRNSWREDLTALSNGWVFKYPIFSIYLIDRAIQPFTLLISPIYFIVSLILGLWIPVITILVWWHLSRLIKMYPHLKKYPRDIWVLPIFVLYNFVSAYIRVYALFSVNTQGWITRWDTSRLQRFNSVRIALPHMLTLVVVLGIIGSISYYKYTTYLTPVENQKKLVARLLPSLPPALALANTNVLGASSLNPETLSAKRYELTKEDTLASLVQKFDVPFWNLLYSNISKIPNWNRVKPGLIMTIPPKDSDLTPNYKFNYRRLYDDTLQVSYEPSRKAIVLSGRGTTVNLSIIAKNVGKEYLEEISPKVWFLKTNVYIRSGVTLKLESKEVAWLKMQSNKNNFTTLLAFNADVIINGVKITSWDENKNNYDDDSSDGRSYILVKDGSRMDITNSEIAYLGYARPNNLPYSPYGISWRMSTGKLGNAILTGEVIGSKFHHNYFGAYTFGATGMTWRGNEFFDNIRYGLDPHDDSNGFIVEDNKFHNNGSHGLIFSKRCTNNIIRNNTSYDNKGHGIMLHELSNNNVIENNILYGNTDGVTLDHSSKNSVRNNAIYKNKRGILADNKSSENIFENNTITSNSQYGVYLYGYANSNIIRDNTLTDNTNAIYIKSSQNQIINNVVNNNKVGVYFVDNAYNNNFQGNQIKFNKLYGVYLKIQGDVSNFIGQGNNMFRNKRDVVASEFVHK